MDCIAAFSRPREMEPADLRLSRETRPTKLCQVKVRVCVGLVFLCCHNVFPSFQLRPELPQVVPRTLVDRTQVQCSLDLWYRSN